MKLLLIGLAAAAAACGGDNTTCGTGTSKMGDQCVADNGSNTGSNTGSGNDVTCGTGTHQLGTMCIPDDTTVAAAPTIMKIDPAEAGLFGGGLFTITGTGFVGSNVTDLHVFFGDPTNMNCEASLGAASATAVSGTIPGGCTLSPSVTVTVQTNVGSATTPFNYDMIFAGDGDAGGDFNGDGGDIYVIDPFAQQSADLGTITDAGSNAYGYSGMDFDATGTLFTATTGDSPADVDGTSQLMSIDISTGTATVISDITDEAGNPYAVTDIKFVGGTLYGWAFYPDAQGDFGAGLISIDTTTATATQIGAPHTTSPFFFGALGVDGSNNLLVAPSGAGSDATLEATGELDTVNTTDGTLTNTATLDWPIGSPVQAMTTFPGTTPTILAVIDNGSYGFITGEPSGNAFANETLAVIDPAATGTNPIVGALFDLPGQIGFQPRIDAIAIPPASLVISRALPRTAWTKLKTVAGGHPLVRR